MRQIWHCSSIFCLLLIGLSLTGQDDSSWQAKPIIHIQGQVETFYVYDFNQPATNYRQAFLYNHNRHNELNVNLAYLKFGVEQAKYRANLALQAGSYANDNYAAEPGLLKAVLEANVGIALNRRNTLWLDMGIMPSHIGFESAISFDNKTMGRSLLAENSPYFQSGIKLSYEGIQNLKLSVLLLNGWQRIQRLQGNSLPSFGTQITYTPSDKFSLNWSSFVGSDTPDSTRQIRVFNNFYSQIQVAEQVSMVLGFDVGLQQKAKQSATYYLWYSPVLIGQVALSRKCNMAARVEYYSDPNAVIIPTVNADGFKVLGSSLNLDYAPVSNILFRLEGRWFNSQDALFKVDSGYRKNNFLIGASCSARFATKLKT